MITKEGLMEAFGQPFTTRTKVAEAMGWQNPQSADKLLYGLERYGKRYWSADVADRVLEGVKQREKGH